MNTKEPGTPGRPKGNKNSGPLFKKGTSFKRACHDCGKPTNNYRCSECWDKIRRSQGLIIDKRRGGYEGD